MEDESGGEEGVARYTDSADETESVDGRHVRRSVLFVVRVRWTDGEGKRYIDRVDRLCYVPTCHLFSPNSQSY